MKPANFFLLLSMILAMMFTFSMDVSARGVDLPAPTVDIIVHRELGLTTQGVKCINGMAYYYSYRSLAPAAAMVDGVRYPHLSCSGYIKLFKYGK